MECYNCGAELAASGTCKQCGADVKIYKKILMASNSLYNEGLEQANNRDLSGAVESLKKSLQLNKMNIEARNLLGLVYFEMGETVAALSEWVISKNYQSRGNAAGRYLSEIQSNPARLESVSQTIKKYNQALIYCRQDSRDLAIIQLKKVLSLNPNLVRGHQLLALLYMQEGKYELAGKALHNAAKIDENNATTRRYLREIKQQAKEAGSKKQKKDDVISYQSGNDTVIMPTQFKDNSAWQTILNIVIGVALGIAITMFLLLPNIRQQSKSESNEALKSANDTISTKEQTIASLENQVEDLTKQVEEAEESATGAETKFASYEQLLSAYASFTADEVEAAGEEIAKVDTTDFSPGVKAIYDDINGKINEKYLVVMYDEGYKAYSQADYETAAEKLAKVVEQDEDYQSGNALYYLAQSYRRIDKMDQAVIYYQKVLEKYPGTERARVAKSYVQTGESNSGGTGWTQGQQQAPDQQQVPDQQAAPDQQQGQDQQPVPEG